MTNTPKPPATESSRLLHYSLNEVEQAYRNGLVGDDELVAYIRAWNAGPHFSEAVWCDGAIRNFDAEETRAYSHLREKYGVRR